MIVSFSGKHAFLSNFYPHEFAYNGVIYPTSEHAYQAAKTLSAPERARIAQLETPGKAKRYGRTIALRPNWDNIKVPIMYHILMRKFSFVPLGEMLIDTDNEELIEGNSWGDRFWGAEWENNQWVGENNLGKLLMLLREEKICSISG